MTREQFKKLLTRNRCSLTQTGKKMGVSPQRVEQLVKEHGLVIQKTVIDRPAPVLRVRKAKAVAPDGHLDVQAMKEVMEKAP